MWERKILRNIYEPMYNNKLGIYEKDIMKSYIVYMENPIYKMQTIGVTMTFYKPEPNQTI